MLTVEQKSSLSSLIRELETQTSGEFVLVINRQADSYWFIPALWAALMALCTPVFLQWLMQFNSLNGFGLAGVQMLVFAVLLLLFRWRPLLMRLIPAAVKQQRAHRIALEQFLLQGVSDTRERTGILFFVSQAEHYVEIIADRGIHEKVRTDFWDSVVEQFIAQLKQGQLFEGYQQAVRCCGAELIRFFPARKDNPNELPDRLLEVDYS